MLDDLAPADRADFFLDLARRTYDLADRCEDAELLKAYIATGGRCVRLACEALESSSSEGGGEAVG